MSNQTQHKAPADITPLRLGIEACRSIMETFSPEELPPAGRWHYHQGVFLTGMFQLWRRCGEARYLEYIKGYVDHLVDTNGNVLLDRGELDSVQAGLLLLELDAIKPERKYKAAADKLLRLQSALNRTTEGGYWHKDRYPYQMWLDGLYMGGVFTMKYGQQYGQPHLYDEVLYQEQLMRKNTRNEASGLYYHAWDESRHMPWADPATGQSPEYWGRSVGWYALSLVEFLDMLPEDHAGRATLIPVLRDLCKALVGCQDPASGLWYQVLDKGGEPDNWLETSCSSLFVYTLAKGVRLGHLDSSCLEHARRGYQGLVDAVYYNERGQLIMPDICIGTGVGDYRHYVQRDRCENDLHGVGALVMACVELDQSESLHG
ncbi:MULTISPECIES: glycoside hydrolase family 88 protein [Paenibacillus]|uniref:Unsaturated rhamnogalacturonyl hydrolase n=1 Tax=Paenibacillus lactis TaxID=228574 RepID=A0ABS4FE69_9BACL|nr:glycoside hydrolase family 88 protein [Paenibacillus lactis]MBP1894546.1 unsaturated rhamnogalacturonyl hydrolase [Paenibacillus lactis]GIO93360.1 unsaturated rhamnogalacturonyl hydrolase YteR [Paenibacillus lactis]HAF98606.1 glycoside hydrolase 105 family protein [Paenibacillus lactis]